MPVHRGVAEAAADVDREMMSIGQRLGENDNWIAGFCRYYGQPVISLDGAFDRVPRLRPIGAHVKEWLKDQIIDSINYAHAEGIDKEEIRNWKWPG